MLGALWRDWRASRAREARTAAYVAALLAEPAPEDVAWLAAHGTAGDADHAAWELRYARRALGLLTAQRDALDDRTASDVARALERAMAADAGVAPEKRRVAWRQLNARLRAYGEAVQRRSPPGTAWHLGSTLLDFAGRRGPVGDDVVAQAGEIAARTLEGTNAALRDCFGVAALPDDIAPSALAARR
ncbi:MAG TPA: hypothetical protein VMT93_07285 [Gemmatimonadaceae bacterium]|nr:hypothetical protein [Gemmatimonadaceae bacterium]